MRNPWLCVVIVALLGSGGILGTIGITLLAYAGKEIPHALVGLVAATFGSLASYVTPPPRGSVGGGVEPRKDPPAPA